MATSANDSSDAARVEALITRLLAELIDAQERATGGRVRDLMQIAELRARLFGLRSEQALLGDKPDPALAVVYADREKKFMHEARQVAKQVIADELEELRAYVLEGTELEERANNLPERE